MLFRISAGVSAAQDQAFKGWPGHDNVSDLKEAFANPPRGYGNVPFYWWTGDSLDIGRLKEQLEILSEASTDGLCVSYNHTHDKVDTELNAAGHGPCGRVSAGEPRVMSQEWWGVWNEFSALCAEKGVGLGMDDYVIAWPGNGEFIDSILAKPLIDGYQGRLEIVRTGRKDPSPDNALLKMRRDRDSVEYICTAPSPWLHPDLGREIVDNYFQPFYDRMDTSGRRGMNYFFQDELQYGLNMTSWCEDMREQFRRRKGYDIVPHLPALFADGDRKTARYRLDYAEVLTQLAEERYFKPIFDWNASKGLIYGCDPEGRGLRPLQYLDYFRAISWFTAPGNDAPARGSSFRQTKVSSSIAHLYGRPRTWLEAFHSMGWDANGAVLKRQLDHHLIAGGNLLCMHGLYYSTHGGWWEWAPPCFHFRMPYWPHMKHWLKYAERMCFLLSQGSHVCDIAILYPTETMQGVPGTKPSLTFAVSDSLSIHGLDYDFIDYRSLQKSQINGRLQNVTLDISGESYRVLVLADTRALHRETLSKITDFIRAGGIVIATGYVMPQIRRTGAVTVDEMSSLVSTLSGLMDPDFRTSSGRGRVLHRRMGDKAVSMVMDVGAGDTMTFRASGKVEKWDAMTGTTAPLPVLAKENDKYTFIRYDAPQGASMLVVFSPGEPVIQEAVAAYDTVSVRRLDAEWDVEIIPTMDNRRGDFRLPAFDGKIGVEARVMGYSDADGSLTGKDCYGYGPYMMACNVPSCVNLDSLLCRGCNLPETGWKPYVWSWQYGVPDSPGSQGWHGLKSRVDSRFLILGNGGHQLFRTNVIVPSDGEYRVVAEGVTPYRILIDGVGVCPGPVHLSEGCHQVLIAYADTRKKEYSLAGMRGGGLDERDRSMVVFYPSCSEGPHEYGMYDSIVASKWYGTDVLAYDIHGNAVQWTYQFKTAPGTISMSFDYEGHIDSVEIDGEPLCSAERDRTDSGNGGSGHLELVVPDVNERISTVVVKATPAPGVPGPVFFREPVKLSCKGGKMPEGDWTSQGALAFYSGAIKYSCDISVQDMDDSLHSCMTTLDLGDVDATCEVSVNGCKPVVLLDKPYSLDITPYLHAGVNRLEVLVYSSLSNHYSTIPSPYRGSPRAGLIGPVRLVNLFTAE
ncbi:MAG: hypothetical protein MJY62_03045 [Bacteroidales bacterium]|nr:hypothetical protein [Bacteroidales bacterium]